MPKNNKKTLKDEPRNADHGQEEQSRKDGNNGKGQVKPTRTHKEQRQAQGK